MTQLRWLIALWVRFMSLHAKRMRCISTTLVETAPKAAATTSLTQSWRFIMNENYHSCLDFLFRWQYSFYIILADQFDKTWIGSEQSHAPGHATAPPQGSQTVPPDSQRSVDSTPLESREYDRGGVLFQHFLRENIDITHHEIECVNAVRVVLLHTW